MITMSQQPVPIFDLFPKTRSPPPFTYPAPIIIPSNSLPKDVSFQITPTFVNPQPSVCSPVNKLPKDGGYLTQSIPSPFYPVTIIKNSVPVQTVGVILPVPVTNTFPQIASQISQSRSTNLSPLSTLAPLESTREYNISPIRSSNLSPLRTLPPVQSSREYNRSQRNK